MAKAMMCDICGDMYVPYGNSCDKPNCLRMLYLSPSDVASYIKHYDCCPACMATLQETINMLGDNKHESD